MARGSGSAPSHLSLCTHPDLEESAAGRGPGFLDPVQAPNWELLCLYHCDHIPGKRIWQACPPCGLRVPWQACCLLPGGKELDCPSARSSGSGGDRRGRAATGRGKVQPDRQGRLGGQTSPALVPCGAQDCSPQLFFIPSSCSESRLTPPLFTPKSSANRTTLPARPSGV